MDHKIKEVIVLAGGLGTRLRPEIENIPKPMADINGKPFLCQLFNLLIKNGIETVILAVGYQNQVISDYFGKEYKNLTIKYSIETKQLGTGGAIKLALKLAMKNQVYIFNGDTIFDINLLRLQETHFANKGVCTIALKHMNNVERYGNVTVSDQGEIINFEEKKYRSKSIINGGIYLVNKTIYSDLPDGEFSFEKIFLENQTNKKFIFGEIFNNYFIDIGIPEDYRDYKKMVAERLELIPFKKLSIDKTWTLFLDRDGVLNHQIINDYVKQVHELKIIDGVPEAVSKFTKLFGKIVIVTNQQGIGKKLMTVEDLEHLNGFIINLLEAYNGKIDKVYFAPQLVSENNNYRKPGTGMGLHAQFDFPEIDFNKSILIGDSEGDIEFGSKLGMKTIMLKNSRNLSTKANYIFENLRDVANHLRQ